MIDPRILAAHSAALGKTGSGKTSTAKLIVEELVEGNARVCILDPIKSDWWGMTSSADGKRPGLPFTILGGPRGHVPLHSSAGAAIAELVAGGQLPLSILDMADFEPGGQLRFFVDFAPVLLKRMRGVLHLVLEEAHLFAPKERSGMGAENMAIHWAKMIATAGRSKGIRLVILTQRTQSLHNAVLGSCETVIAHRLTTPADQKPVNDWLKANVEPAIAKEVAASLSSLKTGEGWICSGEARIFRRQHFPRIRTFDNSATPTNDQEVVDVATAAVDVAALRAIVGDAVVQAEANDPRKLRARIAELEQAAKIVKHEPDGSALLREYQRGLSVGRAGAFEQVRRCIEPMVAKFRGIALDVTNTFSDLDRQLGELRTKAPPVDVMDAANSAVPPSQASASVCQLAHVGKSAPISTNSGIAAPEAKTHIRALERNQPVARNVSTKSEGSSLSKAERTILAVMAMRAPRPSSRVQIAVLSGYSVKSSSFANALGALRSAGRVTGRGDDNRITSAGLADLGEHDAPPTGKAVVDWWRGKLGKAECAIFDTVVGCYPEAVSKEEVSGITGYSIASSSFANALGKLRTLELITGRGELRASEELF